jgi:hypothetical protein
VPGVSGRRRRRRRRTTAAADWLLPDLDLITWAQRALRPGGTRLRRLLENRPGARRALPPAVVLLLVATLTVTVWQLAPAEHGGAGHLAVSGGGPSAGGVDADADAGAEPRSAASGRGQAVPPRPPAPPPARAGGGTVEPADTDGPFPSGVAAGMLAEARAWAEYRGRKVDVVVTYSDRASWQTIVNPWMGSDTAHFRGFSGDWVISQPLFPDSGPEKGSLADCAAGAYNGKWTEFGRWLVDRGRGDSFVRLGWEFNGSWFAWAATNTSQWIQCFRNASSSIKAGSPAARIDWTMNAHGSSTPSGAFALYPGDAYVDVVGIDSYDMYPPSPDEDAFDRQCYADMGLCQAIAFARRHGKLFSVPEWGVVGQRGTKAGAAGEAGGDNPVYITQMYHVFMRNADVLAYEAYFNDNRPGNVHSALANPNLHPRASAVYKQLW